MDSIFNLCLFIQSTTFSKQYDLYKSHIINFGVWLSVSLFLVLLMVVSSSLVSLPLKSQGGTETANSDAII